MKKVLKGGTVVGGSGSVRADVLIDGEKVAAVGTGEEMERLADEDTQIVDVEGNPIANLYGAGCVVGGANGADSMTAMMQGWANFSGYTAGTNAAKNAGK